MKKILISAVFISGIGAAHAATVKCIAFQPANSCSYDNPTDYVDFSANCSGVSVKGIGYCSGQSGDTVGSTSMDLNKNTGIYCWCRMLSPAVSYWVYLESAMSDYQCVHTCSIDCAIAMQSKPAIRSGMFNNIIQ